VFRTYGFDILLDATLKPWLMEVNCAPSLSSSNPLDKRIKNELLTDVFHTIGVKPAYLKHKDSSVKDKAPNTGKSKHSLERIASAASSVVPSARVQEQVVRGGTMGPSNSNTSHATSANVLSPSNAVANSASEAPNTGGRMGKVKPTPLYTFYSNLCKAGLTVARVWRRDRPSRERKLASPLSGRCSDASLDSYAHLFEEEKYEDLLLMKFQKHFAESSKERLCQGLPVEAHEVFHADFTAKANVKRTSTSAGG
jgi:hypothetical protein